MSLTGKAEVAQLKERHKKENKQTTRDKLMERIEWMFVFLNAEK